MKVLEFKDFKRFSQRNDEINGLNGSIEPHSPHFKPQIRICNIFNFILKSSMNIMKICIVSQADFVECKEKL